MRILIRHILLLLGVFPVLAQDREAYIKGKAYDTGHEWVLVADDTYVEDKIGMVRVLGAVNKMPNNPVIVPDQPWEDVIAHPDARFDEATGRYQMWYQVWNGPAWHARHSKWTAKTVPPERLKNWHSYFIGYASSADGARWEKPALDLHQYLDFKKTNIVHIGEDEAEAQRLYANPDTSDPSKRLFMIYSDRLKDPAKGQSLMLAWSADGIRWRVDHTASPLATRVPDGSFDLARDETRKRWFLFRRPDYASAALKRQGPYSAVRANGRYTVSVNDKLGPGWSYPRVVLAPDEEVEWRDIDMVRVIREGTHFIALMGLMDDSQKGLQQVHLAVSPDGIRWTRYPYLPAFLPRGPEGSFDAGQTNPPAVVHRGEFTYLFYAGINVGQRVQQGYYATIGAARMRRGRWIGLKSGVEGGYVLTRELTTSGDRLEVNYQGIIAPYMKPIDGRPIGNIRVELLRKSPVEGHLEPIPGFTFQESDPLVGDGLAGVVTWKGDPDLSRLSGRPVWVRFHVVQSELWGFRFAGGG
ncbi:MAG: hypothetical protein ACKV22_26365 [Bryobacteraceae bacterium]